MVSLGFTNAFGSRHCPFVSGGAGAEKSVPASEANEMEFCFKSFMD